MIPDTTLRSLLSALLNDLVTRDGEPDFQRYRAMESVQKRASAFYDLMRHADDDLSVLLSMYEKDPHCYDTNPACRLQALVDYVKICCTIYDAPQPDLRNPRVH